MKSTKISAVICLLILATTIFGQTKEEAIKKDINIYFDLLGEQKISEALNMVHPELIGMIGKETFEEQYKQMFNSPGLSVTMDNFVINSVSPIFNFDSKDYSLVDYQFIMTFKVDLSKDEDGTLKALLLGTYKRQFGEDNVTFENPDNYVITSKKEMFAVNAEGYDSWKILDFEEGMKMIISAFIPKDVFTHFNK